MGEAGGGLRTHTNSENVDYKLYDHETRLLAAYLHEGRSRGGGRTHSLSALAV